MNMFNQNMSPPSYVQRPVQQAPPQGMVYAQQLQAINPPMPPANQPPQYPPAQNNQNPQNDARMHVSEYAALRRNKLETESKMLKDRMEQMKKRSESIAAELQLLDSIAKGGDKKTRRPAPTEQGATTKKRKLDQPVQTESPSTSDDEIEMIKVE